MSSSRSGFFHRQLRAPGPQPALYTSGQAHHLATQSAPMVLPFGVCAYVPMYKCGTLVPMSVCVSCICGFSVSACVPSMGMSELEVLDPLSDGHHTVL